MSVPPPKRSAGYLLLMAALACLLLLAVLFSLSWGRYPVPPGGVWRSLVQGAVQLASDWHLPFAASLPPIQADEVQANIVLNCRVFWPRCW